MNEYPVETTSLTMTIDVKRLLNLDAIERQDFWLIAETVTRQLQKLGYGVEVYVDTKTDSLDLVFPAPHTYAAHPYNQKVVQIACANCKVAWIRKLEAPTNETPC